MPRNKKRVHLALTFTKSCVRVIDSKVQNSINIIFNNNTTITNNNNKETNTEYYKLIAHASTHKQVSEKLNHHWSCQ